ncbi:hypothetical protein JCM31185_00950 [Furfurilactobacillus curtus]|uniref:Uncharacterized protein n=1 Tax=Furfurilactobacillus curtus TaxID=1746200 RepID=A0ABQ5JKB9_9LACO
MACYLYDVADFDVQSKMNVEHTRYNKLKTNALVKFAAVFDKYSSEYDLHVYKKVDF